MARPHHLATLAKFQLVWRRLCDVMLFRSSCLFEHDIPLRPSVHYPNNIVLKSGWSSTARMPASSLVLLPCLRLTPRRHRQAGGQVSQLYPPSPSFSSFGAASDVRLFRSSCLFEHTLTAVCALPEYHSCRKYVPGIFKHFVNM